MSTRNTLIPLAFLLAAAATVGAEEEVLGGGGPIKMLDTDGDGRVSRAEAQTAATERATKRFDAIDSNKDGYLTQEEVDQARTAARAQLQNVAEHRLETADTDRDGAISRDEAQKGMPMLFRNFDRFDANKDGKVTRDEMPQGKQTRPPLPTK